MSKWSQSSENKIHKRIVKWTKKDLFYEINQHKLFLINKGKYKSYCVYELTSDFGNSFDRWESNESCFRAY